MQIIVYDVRERFIRLVMIYFRKRSINCIVVIVYELNSNSIHPLNGVILESSMIRRIRAIDTVPLVTV